MTNPAPAPDELPSTARRPEPASTLGEWAARARARHQQRDPARQRQNPALQDLPIGVDPATGTILTLAPGWWTTFRHVPADRDHAALPDPLAERRADHLDQAGHVDDPQPRTDPEP
jgi:hypothetical protein